MRISSKGRYGTRAMFDLALHRGDGPQPIRAIAARQGLSEQYLEQLFGKLRAAGLVSSSRGAQGGYELSRPPDRITVGEVLRALEGPIAVAKCLEGAACERSGTCASRAIWQRVNDSINLVVDGITLGDMLADYHQQEGMEHERNLHG